MNNVHVEIDRGILATSNRVRTFAYIVNFANSQEYICGSGVIAKADTCAHEHKDLIRLNCSNKGSTSPVYSIAFMSERAVLRIITARKRDVI